MTKKFNSFMYCIVEKAQFTELEGKTEYNCDNFSTDGNFIIVDKADQDMHTWCNYDDSKIPQYMKDLGVTKCCINSELALAVVGVEASAEGASDGYYFDKADE